MTLKTALKRLELSRGREGRYLKLEIQDQVRHLRNISAGLVREAKKIQVWLGNSLSSKGAGEIPEGQMGAAEHSSSVLKGDIQEEVVRLKSHVNGLLGLLRERGPVGKKFDFLLQEVQRELNTITSKAPRLTVVGLVLEGKERVEKIREQVQNVE